MDCLAALANLQLLGALFSTSPTRTIAVFENRTTSQTLLVQTSDFVAPGLQVLAIETRRRVQFRCSGEIFTYHFWSSAPVTSEQVEIDEPVLPWSPLDESFP